MKMIILGIGNRLMMDDGIGIQLVEELSKHNNKPNFHYLIGESDIDYCLEQIKDATYVIILDAIISGNKPGEISVYSIEDLYETPYLSISPHNFHLFHTLYQQKNMIQGIVIGVEPYEITFNIGMSETIREKWTTILLNVKKIIEEL